MQQQTGIQVLLVDDHAVVRAGYRTLLHSCPDIVVVAEATSGEAACQRFQETRPDVVIMDLSLPGMGGLEAMRRILARDGHARILVFSMHEETAFVEQSLQAGALGYITKSDGLEILIEAVKQVAAGKIYIDHSLAQRLAFQRSSGHGSAFASLSSREFEIFRLLANGHDTADIAQRLPVSAKTVANYRTQIKTKLALKNDSELIHLALRHGLLQR